MFMQIIRMLAIAAIAVPASAVLSLRHTAQAADNIHFAVGPLQPTPSETKKAYDPFFKYLAEKLGIEYTLEATTDWAGIAVALTSGQVDVAWMGPWGYVIAHNQGAGDVDRHRQIRRQAGLSRDRHRPAGPRNQKMARRRQGAAHVLRRCRLDLGLAHSDLLVQIARARSEDLFPVSRGLRPMRPTRSAVANGQSDLATDFDRNRTAMIESGAISPTATKIVWTSDDLPNDAIAVRAGLDPAMAKKIRRSWSRSPRSRRKPYCPSTTPASSRRATPTTSSIEDAGWRSAPSRTE